MTYTVDFSTATSDQLESALCGRLERIRLSRNITQQQLADEAGVSLRTIGRMEKGKGVSCDTFIRVLTALRLQANLETLLPDPTVRPVERVRRQGSERRRARPTTADTAASGWTWADDEHDDD